MLERQYPPSIYQELKAEDGFLIYCQQWKPKGQKKKHPALLLNGYVHEVFSLPTEPTDMVRTLLDQGYETWILQSRLHPSNPSQDFSLDDIAKFDIPAALAKIRELHGPSTKVHVIGALMGGHVPSSYIASLSCTNSSMFFKLTTLALTKLWLPLVPLAMIVLGNNTVLPLLEGLKESPNQWLVKFVTRLFPRYEVCTSPECQVVSGVFGNAFWHSNVNPTLHTWLNQLSQPRLPMSGLRHIGHIGRRGHIVDAHGKDIYLSHPERLALPTLYISGGRCLLATPETTLLAHQYVKLHQPMFEHKRVVVDGFGHSDIFLGQDSPQKVFPHIISHMNFVEEGVLQSYE